MSQPQLEKGLQLALNQSMKELLHEQLDFSEMQVEVFLPRRGLRWQVDQWLVDEKTIYNPRPESVGARYRVVFRLVERLDERLCTSQMRVLWKNKWRILEQNLEQTVINQLICGDHQELDSLCDELSCEQAIGWHRHQPSQPVAEDEPCPFSILVGTGAPVAVWLSPSFPNSQEDWAQLLQCSLSELPTQVMRLRQAGHRRPDQNSLHIGQTIGLIWDDPQLIPPGASQPPRLRMSA